MITGRRCDLCGKAIHLRQPRVGVTIFYVPAADDLLRPADVQSRALDTHPECYKQRLLPQLLPDTEGTQT